MKKRLRKKIFKRTINRLTTLKSALIGVGKSMIAMRIALSEVAKLDWQLKGKKGRPITFPEREETR